MSSLSFVQQNLDWGGGNSFGWKGSCRDWRTDDCPYLEISRKGFHYLYYLLWPVQSIWHYRSWCATVEIEYFFGIRGLPLKLLASYLQGRQQYTVIDGCTSATLNITQEVPQGSSLGPLLFALHINDLPSTTKLTSTLSADATILSISGINSTELQNIVNTELGKVNEWLDFNQLSLNYSKTSHTIVSHKNNQHIDFNSTPFGVLFYWCFSCLIFLCIFFYQFTIYDLVFLFCCLFVYFCDLVFPLLLVFFCFVVTARLSQYSHISLLVNKEIWRLHLCRLDSKSSKPTIIQMQKNTAKNCWVC